MTDRIAPSRRAEQASEATAFVLGCYGQVAATEIRACAASKDPGLRRNALYGLSISKSPEALPIFRELALLTDVGEWHLVADRFAAEGEAHVRELLGWLDASPGKQRVAAHALARIPSELGVSKLLARHQDAPFENALAGQAAKASPVAARAFVADRLARGTRQHKLNALLIAHHLVSYDPPLLPTKHPLLDSLFQASRDAHPEVRYRSAMQLRAYGLGAEFPSGQRSLRRLIEMLRDPSPRVRGEAAGQASQYPSPEVLKILKRMVADPREDPQVRETVKRASEGLEAMLRRLP